MGRAARAAAAESLCERDYHAWALEQAALLHAGRFAELDVANLVEEVEDLSRSERRAVESHLATVTWHLLKLEWSPAAEPRDGWAITVVTHRDRLDRHPTPTLRRHAEAVLDQRYAVARRRAAIALRRDGVAEDALPRGCPYTLDRILDQDFLPANRHGRAP